MTKYLILLLFTFFFAINIIAQTNNKFDSLYNFCVENKSYNKKETLLNFDKLKAQMLNDSNYLHRAKMFYLNFIIEKKTKGYNCLIDTLFTNNLKQIDTTQNIKKLISVSENLIIKDDTKKSIELLNKAIILCNKKDSINYKNIININLVEAYRKDYEFEKAIYLLKNDINYSKISKKDLARAYSRLSANYDEFTQGHIINKNDSAEKYSLLSLKISKEINDTLLIASSQNELGFFYLKRKINFKKAENYLLSAIDIFKKLKTQNYEISAIINASNLYLSKKEYKKSLKIILKGFEFCSYNNSEEACMRFFLQLANVYSYNDMNYYAYQYLSLGRKIQVELLNNKIEKNSLELAAKYDLKIKQAEIDKIKQKNNKEKQQNLIIILVLVITIILLIFIYFNNKLKNKLQKQKEENLILENNNLIKKNEYRSHKLSQAIANIVKQNNSLREIKNLIKSSKIDKAINAININVNQKSEWQNFLIDFSDLYPNFFENIEKKHPNITENEKRLSALLLMNLKSQEIADILSVELSTVNKNRQRLRKKLNLIQNSDITYYLKSEILK